MIQLGSRLVSVLLGVVFASSAAAQTAWKDSPAVRALYAQARQEGKVVVWGPQQREVDWIPQAFGGMFPGIEVQWLGDNNVITKAIAEARAGRNEVDVMHNSLGGIIPLNQRDLLAVPDWSPFGTTASNIELGGKVGLTNNLVYAVVYNKDKVKEADLPKSWTDLLDPKYKGKMVGSAFLLPRLIGFLGIVWGETGGSCEAPSAALPSRASDVAIWGSLTKPPAGIQRQDHSTPSRIQLMIFGPNPMEKPSTLKPRRSAIQ